MFKNHLEMIGRNETPSKKAKFWQSYIRSLKGSEDIRAHETPKARSWRPYSAYVDSPPTYRSIFDEPASTSERVQSHGYRYLPVSRDTYGYSPRAIYDHHYSRTIPASYDAEKAWNDHLKRMQEIERRYPSRYGLYLKDKPNAPNALVPLEYEPEDKLLQEFNKARRSTSPVRRLPYRAQSVLPYWTAENDYCSSPLQERCHRASSVHDPLIQFNPYNRFMRSGSPTPVKPGRWGPRLNEIAYNLNGLPVIHPRSSMENLLNESGRDSLWWDIIDPMPYRSYRSPSMLRDLYSLSNRKLSFLF